MPNRTDALIVGAGASGLICAGFAARRGRRVILLEKMERPARKLMITGKGRCNLTNDCDTDELIAAVRNNGKFLYSAFAAFGPRDVQAFFESLGVPLKTERGRRVFPVSDKATDIVDALVRFAKESGAVIKTGARCEELIIENGRAAGIKTSCGEKIFAGSVVIATGGKSYPATGSTGDGYLLAEQAGHSVVAPRPSLIPIVTEESFCRDLMGLTLRNCRLTLRKRGGSNVNEYERQFICSSTRLRSKPVFDEIGELLFTHFGVSGPLVLSASAHMGGRPGDWALSIDLKPGLSIEQLDARLLRDFESNLNREFRNSLSGLLPRKLIPVMVRLSGIGPEVRMHQITKKQRRDFAALLKALEITPSGFRPIEEAVVTAGGVKAGEINPKTMESKLLPGLYFAGEVIDADAYTGGFNLQIAFSTGYLAGGNV